jgi:RHS repeat-associated protein
MAKTTYMWDELSDNVAAEYEDGVLAAAYTHEPGLYGNLLSQNRNGVTSYYHYDGRGSTVALTDDSGNVTDTKEYDAWGNIITSTGTTVTPYLFVGRKGYQTGNTGVYIRARMYQPTIARWRSVDPLGFAQGSNLFEFLLNSPQMQLDPSGLLCMTNPQDCKDALKEQLKILKEIFENFATYDSFDEKTKEVVKKKCPFPDIQCCETPVLVEGVEPKGCNSVCAGKSGGGGTIPPKNVHGQVFIGICQGVPEGSTAKDWYATVFLHELSHAISFCQQGWHGTKEDPDFLPTCAELICDEMRAYSYAKQCPSKRYPDRTTCLVESTLTSVSNHGRCVGTRNRRALAKELAKSEYCTSDDISKRNTYPKPKELR